jgi:hypothetical protein
VAAAVGSAGAIMSPSSPAHHPSISGGAHSKLKRQAASRRRWSRIGCAPSCSLRVTATSPCVQIRYRSHPGRCNYL